MEAKASARACAESGADALRGAGGYLLNGAKERFMPNYDPLAERATRDFVSRAMYSEIRKGNAGPNGGLYIAMAHLGPERVRRRDFKGMVERCADCGFDLAGGIVEVVPTAHYIHDGLGGNGGALRAEAGQRWRGRIRAGRISARISRRPGRWSRRPTPACAHLAVPSTWR